MRREGGKGDERGAETSAVVAGHQCPEHRRITSCIVMAVVLLALTYLWTNN